MSLEAAKELEKRETIQAEVSADRKWIKWGVFATFITAFVGLIASHSSVLLHLANTLKKWLLILAIL